MTSLGAKDRNFGPNRDGNFAIGRCPLSQFYWGWAFIFGATEFADRMTLDRCPAMTPPRGALQ